MPTRKCCTTQEPAPVPCDACSSKLLQCYPDPCGGCLDIQSFTYEITGSGNPSWGSCHCPDLNSSYYVPLQISPQISSKTFTVYDGFCSGTFPGNTYYRKLTTSGYWLHTDTQILIQNGVTVPSEISAFFASAPACATLTIDPGHYIVVIVYDEYDYGFQSIPGRGVVRVSGNRTLCYVYPMNNGAAIENCPVGDKYGNCSGITTGSMSLIAARTQRTGLGLNYSCLDITDYPLCTVPTVSLTSVVVETSLCLEVPL